jgi:hypothetical protein
MIALAHQGVVNGAALTGKTKALFGNRGIVRFGLGFLRSRHAGNIPAGSFNIKNYSK